MIEEAESHKAEPTGVVQLDDFMQILRNQQWERPPKYHPEKEQEKINESVDQGFYRKTPSWLEYEESLNEMEVTL